MTAKKASKLSEMSIAILENFVRSFLGESFIKLLRADLDNAEVRELLYDILHTTQERFILEYPDADLSNFFRDLAYIGLPSIQKAARIFYDRPTDPTFSRTLAKALSDDVGQTISMERIDHAVAAFLKIFQEELAISSPQTREKLSALVTLRKLESDSKPRIEGDYVMGDKIQISNSTIGMLNSGEIKNIENISVNVMSLYTAGKNDIAQAIKEITEAVTNSTEISQSQRKEILEQIQEISKQATLPPEKRSSTGVLKAIISSLGGAIGTIAGVAQIWSTWGTTIAKFFGF